MLRFTSSATTLLSQSPAAIARSSSTSSQSAVHHLATTRTLSKRRINTKKPLFFSGANRNARDLVANQKPGTPKDSIEKARNELLDKLGSNNSGTVIASA
ncbi:hypothetical protein BGZ93_004299, partial [Podila epicladia]